jgi:hypothetical protein
MTGRWSGVLVANRHKGSQQRQTALTLGCPIVVSADETMRPAVHGNLSRSPAAIASSYVNWGGDIARAVVLKNE